MVHFMSETQVFGILQITRPQKHKHFEGFEIRSTNSFLPIRDCASKMQIQVMEAK